MKIKHLAMLMILPLYLSSCAASGFRYDYGYGAVVIELKGMKFVTKKNVTLDNGENISWGRYLTYKATYTNIAYYWQELPHHHYYFDRVLSKEMSPYYNNRLNIVCDAPTIERDQAVHCEYIVLFSEQSSYNIDGEVNIFVTNNKIERLFYIPVTINNWKIKLWEQ